MAGRTWARALLLATALLITTASPGAWAKNPYSENELHSTESGDETKLRDLRNQEVTQLRITLGRHLPPNRRADLYVRLAEIYMESYRAAFLLEGRAHEKRLTAGMPDKTIDRSYSMPNLHAGIKACQEVISLHLRYDKLDEVYYFLGFNNGELGNKKESARNFEELTKRFPNSAYASEAYRELAEYAYGENQFKRAQSYYELAARYAKADSVPRILHKLAWTFYRTKQFDRAVSTMKEAIDKAGRSGEKFLSLREEALRDMAVFMTEAGQVDAAIAYFQTAVGDKTFYPKLLEKLGKQYERNVEPGKATMVYESILKTSPESDAAFRVLVKLVDLDLRRGRYNEALARMKGVRLPVQTDSDTLMAVQNLRAMVRRTATEHHEEFRKSANRADLEIAEAYYQKLLATFLPKDDPRHEIPEIQMYLAEVKRDLGKAKEASELYRGVVESRDKRYAKEAGALWTASLAEAIKRLSTKSADPSALELEFVDAADRLTENLGETPEGREAALKAAQVLAGYKPTQKDAIKRIQKIIGRWPKSAQALTAARLWLQLLSESPDSVDDLADAGKELRANTALMAADKEIGGGKLAAVMVDQETRTQIGSIAKEEKNKDFSGAGKGYETVAAGATQRDFAEKAYGNAVGSYVKAGDSESVDRVMGAWLTRFPKSPKADDAVRTSATHYLIEGRFVLAAQMFEKLGRDGEGESVETAARLYEGVQDTGKAQSLWTFYLERFPKNEHRWAVALRLARSLDGAHRDSEANKAYQYCMKGPAEYEAECGTRLADLYFRNRDVEQAKTLYKQVAGRGAKHSVASSYVGYARYRLAEILESSQRFEPLRLPEAKLKTALNQRLEFLEPLSRAYMAAVEAGGPWAIAALSRLAHWAIGFADDIDAIPAPPGAPAASVAKFRKNLESVSMPLRRKAVATWADAYSKAVAAEVLSPVLPELADRLADFRSETPGRAQGARGKFRIAGVPADGGSDSRSTALSKTRERLFKNAQDAGAWVDYGNLLWGEGKPLLSKLAYDRAVSLNSRNPAALNNRGVVGISGDELEDWGAAAESAQLFEEALRQDSFFITAKYNRASLFNYYRIFAKARALWEQVVVKDSSGDALDGLAVALQGLNDVAAASAAFRKAGDAGASDSRFTYLFYEASKAAASGEKGASACLAKLDDIKDGGLGGFERGAYERLKGTCQQWKTPK